MSRILSAPSIGARRAAAAAVHKAGAIGGVDDGHLHRLVGLTGGVLTVASLLTSVMLWWSPRFGTPEWEFSTVSQTIDNLPLLTIGVLLLSLSAVRGGVVWMVRLTALLLLMLGVAVVAISVLYLLAAAVAWNVAQSAPPEALSLVARAVVKTMILAAMYCILFSTFAVSLWRRT